VAELFDLALAQPTDRACEQPGDLGAERGGEIGGPSEQEVAGQDRLQVAPFCVDRVDAAPSVSLVEHVVVVQRSEVHELAGHAAEHDVVVGRRASDCGGDNGDHRPQSLAAGDDQVRGDLGEVRVRRLHRGVDRSLDALAITSGRREQGRPCARVGHAWEARAAR